ncbi:MAG: ribulose-phosphate 3-epimerase [Patescibacteria group bacterium]|nr:MAG: ribulose-phosphate 3-epimerase [Patescibacteria group bacterium]
MQIIPALLEKDLDIFEKKLKLYLSIFKSVHIDIADNTLVHNSTLSIADLTKTPLIRTLYIDLHLMTENIDKNLEQIKKLTETSLKIKNIFIPYKTFPDLNSYRSFFNLNNIYIYIDPNDEIETVLQLYNKRSDLKKILVLTVNPGFQGSPFIPYVLDNLTKFYEKDTSQIYLDGGINDKSAQYIRDFNNLISAVCVGSYFASSKSKTELTSKVHNLKKLLTTS